MKKIKFWLTSIILFLLGIFLSSCISFPEKMQNETEICYQNRICYWVVLKVGGKDLSGCTAIWSVTCKKQLVRADCKKEEPDNQSNCREKLN